MYYKVISVQAWVSEITLSEIERVTWLVVWCLNQMHHHVPHLNTYTALLYSLLAVTGDMPLKQQCIVIYQHCVKIIKDN